MNLLSIIVCSLLTCFIHADDCHVNGGNVSFDGKIVTLTGHATIEHDMGIVTAEQITASSTTDKRQFNAFQLNKCVSIIFNDGGTLSCDKALIDNSSNECLFLGDDEQHYVHYSSCLSNTETGKKLLELRSHSLKILLTTPSSEGTSSSRKNINKILADGDVQVNYNNELSALADYAVYTVNQGSSKTSSTGIITFHHNLPHGICHVVNRSGDTIHATEIIIDPEEKKISFNDPHGWFQNNDSRIDFSANQLLWDQSTATLTLKENITITPEGLGNLQNSQEVRIYQTLCDGVRMLDSIEADGTTTIDYLGNLNTKSTLTSFGALVLDNKLKQIKLSSPDNIEGKQVHFQDTKGDIYADEAKLFYTTDKGTFTPIKITLSGNVSIYNNILPNKDGKKISQYVLADQVEFFPATREILFKANQGHRVLLFDDVNKLEVSAPSLKMIRDGTTGKDSIKGVGDVRFRLIERELNQLRQKFGKLN